MGCVEIIVPVPGMHPHLVSNPNAGVSGKVCRNVHTQVYHTFAMTITARKLTTTHGECMVKPMNTYFEAHSTLRDMFNLTATPVLDDAESFIHAVVAAADPILTRFGYTLPEGDYTAQEDSTLQQKLTALKAEIQENFNTSLSAYQKSLQKNYRRIDELTNKISNLQPGKNASEESRAKAETAIAELTAEIEALKTEMSALFTAFYTQRVCEETFRNIPQAQQEQTVESWYWTYLSILRILPSIHHAA